MPLAAVTSVKCSVRVPSARDNQIVAIQPVVGLPPVEPAALHQVDVEIAVVVVVEERHTRAENLRHVELTRHAIDVDEVDTGLGGAIDKPLCLRCRRVRLGGVLFRMATASHEHEDGESGVTKAHSAVVYCLWPVRNDRPYFFDARSIAFSTVLVMRDT